MYVPTSINPSSLTLIKIEPTTDENVFVLAIKCRESAVSLHFYLFPFLFAARRFAKQYYTRYVNPMKV